MRGNEEHGSEKTMELLCTGIIMLSVSHECIFWDIYSENFFFEEKYIHGIIHIKCTEPLNFLMYNLCHIYVPSFPIVYTIYLLMWQPLRNRNKWNIGNSQIQYSTGIGSNKIYGHQLNVSLFSKTNGPADNLHKKHL